MTAAMKGPLRPLVNRFKLGSFEVTTILDGAQNRDSVRPPFAINQPAATVSEHAHRNLLPDTWFENTFTPTLVNTGRELVLFDTGNGALRRDVGAGFLRERLSLAGYRPDDVDTVVFTHMHPDHIGGAWEDDAPAYANARYVMGRHEFEVWSSGDGIPDRRAENRTLFQRLIPPLAQKTTFLEPDDEVVSGVRAVKAFGHSLGHMAYSVESDGQTLLIWGDTTNHFAFSLQQPDWHLAIDDDPEQAAATRKHVLDMVATDRMLAIGHHMPFPAVGYVERHGGGYRWQPAAYQLWG
jgi:glyoxylase-like metal-dependent hydrolase (beta-lactamase superfamily II)